MLSLSAPPSVSLRVPSISICIVLLSAAFAVAPARAQNRVVKFVAPETVANVDGVPQGAYVALAGHFHHGTGLDFAFSGDDHELAYPISYSDIALNEGGGNFQVISGVGEPGGPGPFFAVDVNGDGITDLIFSNSNGGGGFQLVLEGGDCTVSCSQIIQVDAANSGVVAMAAADFDGNGTMDLAVLTTSNTLVILLNDGTGSFRRAFSYAVSGGEGLAVGDFNGDKVPDVEVGGTIFLGKGGGALTEAGAYAVGPGAVVADMNHDGFDDLVFLTGTGVKVLLGSASGEMTPGASVPVADGGAIAVGDFNHDGAIDLAVAGTLPNPPNSGLIYDASPSFVNVYFGNGHGGWFPSPTVYGTGNQPVSFIAGDVYGSGNIDLVTFGASDASLTILRNIGNGYFVAAPVTHSPGATGIVAGDFNRDGKQDVAVVNSPACKAPCSGTVTVFPGSGSDYFNPGKKYTIAMHGAAIAAGDLNGDGIKDLVVVNSIAGDAADTSVLLGKADGTFQSARNYTLGSLSNDVVLIDVNKDGKLDLVEDGGVALCKGDGTFEALKPFPGVSFGPFTHLAVGDFKNNGIQDVVATSAAGACGTGFQVFLGDGKGGFTSGQQVEIDGTSIISIAVGRLRTGGPLDIVYSVLEFCSGVTGVDSSIGSLAGNGDGTFATTGYKILEVALYGGAEAVESGQVVIADFNGDGKADVGVGSPGHFVVSRGNGDGTFQPQQDFTVADSNYLESLENLEFGQAMPGQIAVADFTRDGRLDVVLTSGLGVSRLYNVTAR
jgi:hypothetical protein